MKFQSMPFTHVAKVNARTRKLENYSKLDTPQKKGLGWIWLGLEPTPTKLTTKGTKAHLIIEFGISTASFERTYVFGIWNF